VQDGQLVASDSPAGRSAGQARPFAPPALLRAVRPKQFTKNLVVFAALLFTVRLAWQPSRPDSWLPLLARATLGFAAFCAVAAAGYLINDLRDVDADRRHPRKRLRPIASGELSERSAIVAAAALYAAALALALPLGWRFVLALCIYGALVTSYTYLLKHLVLLDVLAIALGFVLRAIAGALAIRVPVSPWLYLCTLLGALLLAINKRRHELVLLGEDAPDHRAVLAGYSVGLVDALSAAVASATVLAYALYSLTAANLPANHAMLLTLPFVLFGVYRYQTLMRRHDGRSGPEEVLVRDRPLLVCVALWLLTAAAVLAAYR